MAVAQLLILARQGGKTHLLAHWCKKNGGIFFCFSQKEADRIKEVYDVDAISLNGLKDRSLSNRPVAIDNLWNMTSPSEALRRTLVVAGDYPVLASIDPIFEITSKVQLEKEIWPEEIERKKEVASAPVELQDDICGR